MRWADTTCMAWAGSWAMSSHRMAGGEPSQSWFLFGMEGGAFFAHSEGVYLICRDVDEHHRLQWDLAGDEIGQQMMALVKAANGLRRIYPSLRHGEVSHQTSAAAEYMSDWDITGSGNSPIMSHGVLVQVKILHEDRPNGVVAFERVDGLERIVTVINAGQSSWQGGEYGCWVGGGSFKEVFSSQVGLELLTYQALKPLIGQWPRARTGKHLTLTAVDCSGPPIWWLGRAEDERWRDGEHTRWQDVHLVAAAMHTCFRADCPIVEVGNTLSLYSDTCARCISTASVVA